MPATKLRKDVIKPGVYYPSGGEPREVTRSEIDRWNANHARLTAKGYRVPLWMQHPGKDERKSWPMTEAKAKELNVESDPWFIGFLDGFEVDKESGLLSLEYTEQDGRKAKALSTMNASVSPQFGPWKDDEKEDYDGIVGHVAVTKKPVNKDQLDRFESVTEKTLAFGLPEEVCVFGMDDEVPPEKSKKFKKRPVDDKLADPQNSDPASTDEQPDEEESGDPINDENGDGVPDEQQKEASPEVVQAATDLVLSLLKTMTQEQLMSALKGLLDNATATSGQDGEGEDTDSDPDFQTSPVTVSMSEDDMAEIDDLKAQVQQFGDREAASQKRITALRLKDFNREQGLTRAGIESAVGEGRMSVADGKKLVDELATFQFSEENENGEAGIAGINQRLEWSKSIPKGTFFSDQQRVQQFGYTTVPVQQTGAGYFTDTGNVTESPEQEAAALAAMASGNYAALDAIAAGQIPAK
jgi:hypothetical protein